MTTADEQRSLGKYRLESLVARGGMGEIWRGRDTSTDQAVAVKRLFVEHSSEAYRARLMREAQALKRLSHENVVRLLDAGFDETDQPYLVLEWLEGQDLDQQHRESPLDLSQVLDVVRQALRGLAVCHEQGIVHRDIKPANLFLVPCEDGFRVKVLDLGLALLKDDATRLTATRAVMGTINYLSPEQARGEYDVDHRADLYATGVVLYELCTGKLPFSADQEVAVLLKIVTETPPPPRQLRPDLPLWLENVISRAMQRSPSDRYTSASEMLEALTSEQVDGKEGTPRSSEADSFGDTISLAMPTGSMENRLVSMLCVQPFAEDREIAEVTQKAVENAGGLIYHLIGGQMVGFFGLERTFGDEGFRAVRAGQLVRNKIGMQARLLAATVHLEVGAGLQLNSDDLDRTISALSDLPPGELIVDASTRQLVGPDVELKQMGDHHAVVALAPRERARSRLLGVDTPTIGRNSELAAIRGALQQVIENEEAEAVLVLGRVGIGKSRLVSELMPELRERCSLCLEARGDSSKSKTPYSLFADAIARQAGLQVGGGEISPRIALHAFISQICSSDRAGTMEFIGEAIGVPFGETPSLVVAREDPKVMRERVTLAFESLFRAAVSRGPVALCFDDLHWADEESLSLCEEMLERLEQLPIFVLSTSGPDLLERRPTVFEAVEGTRIELGPLGRRSLHRLIRSLFGRVVSKNLEALINRWCEGNPYFAEELVSWLQSRRDLEMGPSGLQIRGDPTSLELPVGVNGAIQSRLDRLEPGLKELVKAASVFGEALWESGCEAMGFADVSEMFMRLEAEQFVSARSESRYAGTREWSFRSSLVQQVAYKMLPPESRRLLHAKAARWLESIGETDAVVIGSHFQRGGEIQPAADYYAKAAARSLADGDLDQAVEHYKSSLLGSPQPQDQVERSMGLTQALIHLGRYDEAWQIVDPISDVLAFSNDIRRHARITFLKGRILYALGRYPEAESALKQAAEGLDAQADAALLFDINHTLFWVIWVQGRYDDATQAGWELYLVAESARTDHKCSAKLALTYCHLIAGDPSEAMHLADDAVGHAREIGHPFREADSLMLLGSAQEIVGHYEQATQSLQSALALATRLKTVFLQASINTSLGYVYLALGNISSAMEHFQSASEHAEAIKENRTLAAALAGKARALCLQNQGEDLLRAYVAAEQALKLSQDQALPVEAESRMTLAQVCLAMGKKDHALEHAAVAVKLLDKLGTMERFEIEILLTAHDALEATDRADEARAVLTRAWQTFEEQAERITDAAVRDSFLHNVPHNERLSQLWQGTG